MGETSGAPGPACAAIEETRHCRVVSKFKDDVRVVGEDAECPGGGSQLTARRSLCC